MKLKFKQTLMAFFALAIILTSGFNQEAKAFSVVNGDLYLALYGNGTEKYYDLGTVSNLLTTGSLNLGISAADLTLVGGANPVKWSIAGYDTSTSTLYNSIKTFPLTASQNLAVSLIGGFSSFAGTFGLNTDGTSATSMSLLATNTQSYSQTQDPTGNGSFNSSFPVTTSGVIGSTFAMISGDYTSNVLSALNNTAGKALFASVTSVTGGGLALSMGAAVAAVPLPASVVMFGTGLIALAGIARRKLFFN